MDTTFYLGLKSFHIICIIAWMAGLLYLPRLYVYHHSVNIQSEASETFKIMERKLLKIIMNPAMIASCVSGFYLLWLRGVSRSSLIKLLMVVGLTIVHGALWKWQKMFEKDERPFGPIFFRAINEVPTILMIIIVILVVVKPF